MAKPLVDDELWSLVEPLLPEHPPSPKGGHPRIPDRVCLSGLVFMLKTGIPWEDFPQEMGCCGMTLWNRLREWQAAGVWPRLHGLMLAALRRAGKLDLSRVVVDSGSIRAVHGGKKRAPARWTAEKGAPSTTSRWMPGARLCRSSSPGPTPTMSRSCSL